MPRQAIAEHSPRPAASSSVRALSAPISSGASPLPGRDARDLVGQLGREVADPVERLGAELEHLALLQAAFSRNRRR